MWGRNDLKEYRAGYPDRPIKARKTANLEFYRNQRPMEPEGVTIEEVHEDWWTEYDHLEVCHSYIQWLFPIQEKGLNYAADPLEKLEIHAIRHDEEVKLRFIKSFDMMLNFYGFVMKRDEKVPLSGVMLSPVKSRKRSPSPTRKSSASPTKKRDGSQKGPAPKTPGLGEKKVAATAGGGDDVEPTTQRPVITAHPDAGHARSRFLNLVRHPHNFLRITRILKCLGEIGHEDMKIAWLLGLHEQIYLADGYPLGQCSESFESYWMPTIYDDKLRKAFEERVSFGKAINFKIITDALGRYQKRLQDDLVAIAARNHPGAAAAVAAGPQDVKEDKPEEEQAQVAQEAPTAGGGTTLLNQENVKEEEEEPSSPGLLGTLKSVGSSIMTMVTGSGPKKEDSLSRSNSGSATTIQRFNSLSEVAQDAIRAGLKAKKATEKRQKKEGSSSDVHQTRQKRDRGGADEAEEEDTKHTQEEAGDVVVRPPTTTSTTTTTVNYLQQTALITQTNTDHQSSSKSPAAKNGKSRPRK